MSRKGIILAGGLGTRLYPATKVISKHLLPIFDKPMIYYPLTVLMMAGIRDILVITTPNDSLLFSKLLGDGSDFGINVSYEVQPKPDGLAQAFIIGANFIGGDDSALILGDNIFYGHNLPGLLESASSKKTGATIFLYKVRDPERYGVAEFDEFGKVIGLEEKPAKPKSQFAVTGLYFYDNCVIDYAKEVRLSARSEFEITDINNRYCDIGSLNAMVMGRGYAWLDTGTHSSLLHAHQFVETLESRQGMKISCPEEVAFRRGWIDSEKLERAAKFYENTDYGQYLSQLTKGINLP